MSEGCAFPPMPCGMDGALTFLRVDAAVEAGPSTSLRMTGVGGVRTGGVVRVCAFPPMTAKERCHGWGRAPSVVRHFESENAGYLTPKCTRRVIDTVVVVMEFTAQRGR